MIENKFFLYEFTNHGDLYFKYKKSFVMYVYFSPREINDLEKERLNEIKDSKPEYYKGVKEGYSVLFIGGNKPNYIIKSGIQSKNQMIKQVPNSYWEKDVTYYDLSNRVIFPTEECIEIKS